MTPIFSRSWLVKTRAVLERLTTPVSLRSAWLMRRAWMPTNESPISPSISARGTSAATESTTTQSMPPERMSVSVISSACSPVSGWLTSSSSTSTPQARAYCGSRACSTSMKATTPPRRCASARTCWQSVVLPDDSGPKISVMRPRGTPPTPSARSRAMEPVGMASICCRSSEPSRMIEPCPNCFSMDEDGGFDRLLAVLALGVPRGPRCCCRCGCLSVPVDRPALVTVMPGVPPRLPPCRCRPGRYSASSSPSAASAWA